MSLSSRVSRLVPDLAATLERFPACVLAAVTLCIIANLEAGDATNFDQDVLTQIYSAGTAAFLAGGVGHLFALGRKWRAMHSAMLGLAAGSIAALLCYFYTWTGGHPPFILPSLAVALMIAAYFRRGTSEEALWLFNARLGLAFGLAVVISIIFVAGLSAILASLEYLFEINVPLSLSLHTWATAATLIGPVYGLSLMPTDLDEKLVLEDRPGLLDRGISILVNYVMVPIAAIYIVILHLYAGKIALTWELPKGQIGIMVLLFGLGGTATYLIARPWVGRGTTLLRWFLGSWFWFTIVPAALLAIGVWTRVAEYGITPDRYGLVLIGIWLFAMAIYLAVRRMRADSRVILASLGGLLLVASFGPWGARDLSVANQMSRLMAILQSNDYLEDGRLVRTVPSEGAMSSDDSSEVRSIVNFLGGVDALRRLEPLFAGRGDSPFDANAPKSWQRVSAIMGQLNLTGDNRTFLSYTATAVGSFEIGSGTRLSGPYSFYSTRRAAGSAENVGSVDIRIGGDAVEITQGSHTWRVAIKDILTRAAEFNEKPKVDRTAFAMEAQGDTGPVRLLVQSATGRTGGAKAELTSLNCWLLLPAE